MTHAHFAGMVTLPVIIDACGAYETRSGGYVLIEEVSTRHDYGCKGRYESGERDNWHRSGRLYATESGNDIIRKAAGEAVQSETPKAATPAPVKLGKPASAPRKPVEVLDVTPSWEGMVPIILMLLENGDATGRKTAREELTRMARIADAYVASRKEG